MQKKFLFALMAILFLGIVTISVQAAMVPTQESSWKQFGDRLKAVFFPSLYTADTNNLSSSYSGGSVSGIGSSSGSGTSYSATGTSTAGYTCNKTSKTCSYVSSNAEYKGTTDTIKNTCNTACKGTSGSNNYSGGVSSGATATEATPTKTGAAPVASSSQSYSTSGNVSGTGSSTSGSNKVSGSGTANSAASNTQSYTNTGSAGATATGGTASGFSKVSGSGTANSAASSAQSYTNTGSAGATATGGTASGFSNISGSGASAVSSVGSSSYTGGGATSWQTNTGASQVQSQTGASWQTPVSGGASWQTVGGNTTGGLSGGTQSWAQPQSGTQTGGVESNSFSGMLKNLKDLFNPQPIKTDTIQTFTSTSTSASNLQDQINQLLGDKDKTKEGTECKITSITFGIKATGKQKAKNTSSIYEIGDVVNGKVNTSCAKGVSISKYIVELDPEGGQKGGGIPISVDSKGEFNFTIDINVISMLAKAGQSGKIKLQIATNVFFDSTTGESKYARANAFLTVDLGDAKTPTDNNDGTKITKKIEFTVDKKEYKSLEDTIKLTITGKPAGMKDCGYNIEADYQNTGKYGWKNDGVEIKDCNGSINIPVNKAYKIKLSVSGWTTKSNGNIESYTSNPASVEIKYNPKAKETPKTGVNNDCYLEITSMSPNSNKIFVSNQQTQDITVKFKLHCTDYNKIDVRPTRVSAYIDIFNLNNEQKESKECGAAVTASDTDDALPYKQGTEYTITCSSKLLATLPNDARLKLLMVDMYYMTDMETGTEHGTHLARFISTRDRVEIVTNGNGGKDEKGKDQDKKIITNKESIVLTVSPTSLAKGGTYYLKAVGTVGEKALCAVWSNSSDNKNGWWWEHGHMSLGDMIKILPTYNFVKSSAKAEYLQVRCAEDNVRYYSNTVTVTLKEGTGSDSKPEKETGNNTKDAMVLKVTPTSASAGETLKMNVTSNKNIPNAEKAPCEITWTSSDGKKGTFASTDNYIAFLETANFTGKKDTANQTYIQARCKGVDGTMYYSNTVTVSLKTFGKLSVISNIKVKTILNKLENSKETNIIPQGYNVIENKSLATGSYVIYSSVPEGYDIPSGWSKSNDYPGYIYLTFDLTEVGKIIRINFSKTTTSSSSSKPDSSTGDSGETLLIINNPDKLDVYLYHNKQPSGGGLGGGVQGGAMVNNDTTMVYNQTGNYEIYVRVPTGYSYTSPWTKASEDGFMYQRVILEEGQSKTVNVTIKALPGSPSLPTADKTMLYISNPLGVGHKIYYTSSLNGAPTSLLGEHPDTLSYGKQAAYRATGTYKIMALLPPNSTIPDNTWTIESGFMTKTVTLAKDQTKTVVMSFKDKVGNNTTDKGVLIIRSQFTADVFIWHNGTPIGGGIMSGGSVFNNTKFSFVDVGEYKIKTLVPGGYTVPDNTWVKDGEYMITTVNLKKGESKAVFITFKNLPGFPPLPPTVKTLLVVSNPLGAFVKRYYNGSLELDWNNNKQFAYITPGSYKFIAQIPYGYKVPKDWRIENGNAVKEVYLEPNSNMFINVKLEFWK